MTSHSPTSSPPSPDRPLSPDPVPLPAPSQRRHTHQLKELEFQVHEGKTIWGCTIDGCKYRVTQLQTETGRMRLQG